MKKLEKRWNGIDNIDLYVSTKNLPLAVKEYTLAPESCMARCKIEEEESGCLDEETMSDIIWQNHPANSFRKEQEKPEKPENQEEPEEPFPNKKRERFIRSKHAIDRKRRIEPLTMSLRPTRNGGIKEGAKSSVRAYFKRYDRRIQRYENKKIPVESTVSPFDPLDGDFLDFNPDTIDSYEVDEADGRLWKKAEKIAASEDELWRKFEEELERDSALLEENLKNWEWDEPSPVGVVEPEDQLQAQVESLKTQVQNLTNEINRLNSFLQEFNLNKLYEQFLLDKGHEFF